MRYVRLQGPELIWSRVTASVPPPSHSRQARHLIQANSHRDGARILAIVDVLGTRTQHRATPPHTDENDADDAADNDEAVLLACWCSECDCW